MNKFINIASYILIFIFLILFIIKSDGVSDGSQKAMANNVYIYLIFLVAFIKYIINKSIKKNNKKLRLIKIINIATYTFIVLTIAYLVINYQINMPSVSTDTPEENYLRQMKVVGSLFNGFFAVIFFIIIKFISNFLIKKFVK